MITANQPQVTSRPVQLRCSSQPMGLRWSFQRIQRRRKPTQIIGVQNVVCNQICRRDGGSSRQIRRVRAPAANTAAMSTAKERIVSPAMTESRLPLETRRKYTGQVPREFVIKPIPDTTVYIATG